MPRTQVLIVGAGPTGLILAFWLTRLGVGVRIVDRTAGPGTTSRAVAVQARTLELYRQFGLDEAVCADGQRVAAGNLWVGARRAARLPLGPVGQGLSAYPYLLMYPQDAHERMLAGRLAEIGVTVDRETELVAFTQDDAGVTATLASGETVLADYIVGCDGAHSLVRKHVAADFPGGTYAQLFYVADVQAHGPAMDGELHVDIDAADFLAVFPLKGKGRARLIGTISDARAKAPEDLTFADVSGVAMAGLKIEVDQVNWFSTYRVHHRVVDAFRKGRAFVAGDAAHIHSPVGGQGMNTGLGDAINLAWKLAAVLQGRAPDSLLDSYQTERIAFARRLVATTDRIFTLVTSSGPIAKFVRIRIVPRLAPLALRFGAARRALFLALSQTGVAYPDSALSEGRAGPVTAGERMPWVETAAGDNFAGLDPRFWHVMVFGRVREDVRAWCAENGVGLHLHSWSETARQAGVRPDALYLLRPDGYVALAAPNGSASLLARYFKTRGLRPA